MCIFIEAFTHGNSSSNFERNFSYRKGPIFRATLWPNQWSHRGLLGIKWKIWTLSFHWYPLVFCGLSGLDTTVSQSLAIFLKINNAENWPVLFRVAELKFFDIFFQTAVILRPIEIMAWNQGQMKLKIPNFHDMKTAYS